MLRGKCIGLNDNNRKEVCKINGIRFPLKKLEKEE